MFSNKKTKAQSMNYIKYIITVICLFCSMGMKAQDLYVSTEGNDSNEGSESAPLATVHKAVELVTPGCTIWIHGGTYYLTERIIIPRKATSADKRICMFGVPSEKVIIDGSQMSPTSSNDFKMSRCIYVPYYAKYWHFKNLELCNAKDNGMKLEGSYCIVENCVFHDNNDSGLQIGMYKDWAIEETKSYYDDEGNLISGTPAFNPDYQFCKYNVALNCDSYYNNDATSYSGSDDGGDADGFACKLFPGPGTEFHNCRSWCNSDDGWDLYMVYHPVIIDGCRTWGNGYDKEGNERGNGNGFKLGGGGSSGGAAFDQSTGAHVVTNCISFNNLVKGFDQNNAYEGMYLFNNLAFGNEYNYRFPTLFEYGGMYIRNCIGFNAEKYNHEFLSADKEGAVVPNTAYNSWTTLDGCDPYKESNKVDGTKVYTKDYTSQFKSLEISQAMAARSADGSLPDNDFARLIENSVFIDAGEIIENFTPARFMTEAEANGIELLTAANITIPYNEISADMGAFESGAATRATLTLYQGKAEQLVYSGNAMEPVIYCWGQAATDVTVMGLTEQLIATKDSSSKTITIEGIVTEDANILLQTVGGENVAEAHIVITCSNVAPATLDCLTNNATQTIDFEEAVSDIIFQYGGGATGFEVSGLPAGLSYRLTGDSCIISGIPAEDGAYSITAVGGMQEVTLNGYISREVPTHFLAGDETGWYHFQDESLPADLTDVFSLVPGENDASYPTVLNPAYVESDGSVPGGCTTGAVNIERGGAVRWELPSVAQLILNLHFTGKRTFTVTWSIDGGTEQTWTSESYSKGTYCNWDLLSSAGIEATEKPIVITFKNNATNGGLRVYDMQVNVYGKATGITPTLNRVEKELSIYQTETFLVAQGNEWTSLALYTLSGKLVSHSSKSQVLSTLGLPKGIYLLRAVASDGKHFAKKIVCD